MRGRRQPNQQRIRSALAAAHIARRQATERRQARVRRLIIGLLIALAVPLLPVFGFAAYVMNMPVDQLMRNPHNFPADSLIYDRNGTLLADVHQPGITRLPVTLQQISPIAVTATIDTEDRNFWGEGAIDVGRFVSAAAADAQHKGNLQGASTIAMQLAKLLYLKDTRSLAYKIQEISLAAHLVDTLPKSEILDAYLNDIPFGNSAIGIQAAAHTYFAVDASNLDLAQASYLAGLPNAPSQYDPFAEPQAAKARQGDVLRAMLNVGDITQAQLDAAAAEPITLADGTFDNRDATPAFVSRVISEVSQQDHLNPAIDGLRIRTTLDWNLQQKAQQVVAAQIATLGPLNVTDGALVSIDPQSGDIVAYVGSAGRNVPGAKIDMAAVARQPGSTFKLFTYSTAIAERTISMLTPVLDGPLVFPTGGGAQGLEPYRPLDYDRRFHGMLPAEVAMGNSLNTSAIRVEQAVGLPKIIDEARRMGVTTLTEPDTSYGVSTTLGTAAVPLWEMAQAASVFAAQGTLNDAHTVLSVTDSKGGAVSSHHNVGKAVLTPQVAAVMNDALSNDSNRWIEFGRAGLLTLPGHRVAAKTGTTEDFKDNLTIGWTPRLVTATWVGNADDEAMQGTTGITGAAPIWNAFMSFALADSPDNWSANPPGVSPATSGGHSALLLDGTTPTQGANLVGGRSSSPGFYCWGWYQGHWCGNGEHTAG